MTSPISMTRLFCLLLASLAIACGGDSASGDDTASGGDIEVLTAAVVEASCGECQFGMAGEGCTLAVRTGGQSWFVDGTGINDHGDSHAEDGFCSTIREAKVTGKVVGGRMAVTEFELVDA